MKIVIVGFGFSVEKSYLLVYKNCFDIYFIVVVDFVIVRCVVVL